MNIPQEAFKNDVVWFGYLESGKTISTRDHFVAGTQLCADYQLGWDIGVAELSANNDVLNEIKYAELSTKYRGLYDTWNELRMKHENKTQVADHYFNELMSTRKEYERLHTKYMEAEAFIAAITGDHHVTA